MKKHFLILLAALLSTTYLQAQALEDEGYGPQPEELLIEITGNPFVGSSLLNFGMVRARYMLSYALVPRVGVQMNINNYQTTPDLAYNISEFTLMPGVEFHLQNEGKFHSYVAVDALAGMKNSSLKSTTGASVSGATSRPSNNNQNLSNRGFFRVGAQVGFGADYHFNSRFYIGTEVGIQLIRQMNSEIKVDGELYQAGTTTNTGGINTTNSFRIGFKLL